MLLQYNLLKDKCKGQNVLKDKCKGQNEAELQFLKERNFV